MTTIVRFQAENYKRLKAVEIVPGDGNMVPIIGENAQGKSSVLDAITAALGGKSYMPSHPVRKGEEEGAIRLELSNGLIVRRIFDKDGSGTIVVENGEGMKASSPQGVLDKLYSSVAFDPIAFTRLEPKDQLKTLRQLVELEVDVDALAAASKQDYDERTGINRDAKQLQAQIDAMQVPEGEERPVDEDAILAKINGAADTNATIERRRVKRESFVQLIEEQKELIEQVKADIARLQQELTAREAALAENEKTLAEAEPLPEPVDTSALMAELQEARAVNARVQARRAAAALKLRHAQLVKHSKELTDAIAKREEQRIEAFKNAAMPVPGLSFGEDEVLFNDLPLDQASTAEQLRISTAIGMATAPELKVMLIRDASLLDRKGYELLATMAAEHDFQFWVEAVDDGQKVGIVMEDGAVKGAPEPAPIDKGKRRKKKDDAEAQQVHAEAAAEPKPEELQAGLEEAAGGAIATEAVIEKKKDEQAAQPKPKPQPVAPQSLFD